MSSQATLLAAALLALAPALPAFAADGYLITSDGQAVTDASGDCWHTGEWRAAMRFANCEPRPKPPLAAAAAPKPQAPMHYAEAPAKPAPRPAPFKLSADTLFEFDSALLTPDGRVALDRLERQIGSAHYDSMKITGHTDRLGAASYNQRLSERRAHAVRDYLVAHGVEAARISASGVGSAQPVTAPDACGGSRNASLIQCLQPDRYAEVAVVATVAAASVQ